MKYMGSKARIAKHILPIILRNRKNNQYYVEPFCGGANIIDKVEGLRIGGELNIYVAALLQKISAGWLPPENVSEKTWLQVKNNKDDYEPHFVGFCGICLSFGSVWFCAYARDKKGNRNYAKEAYRNLQKQAKKLQGIKFICSDYRFLPIPDKSIIYCDPPYEGTDKYRGFEQINHADFWQWIREKVTEGHEVYVSEFNAPKDFYCVWELEVSTRTAEKALGKIVTEKLFVHKSQMTFDLL